MKQVTLGPVGGVSRLTLGGGGIGECWGATSRDEAIATARLALDSGITLLDTAPIYRNCEIVIAEAFGGRLPSGVRITSKCYLGSPPKAKIADTLALSLEASLAAMKLQHIDLFFLHTNICRDDYVFAFETERQDIYATRWPLYVEAVVPALEALQAAGKIGHWGITGIGTPDTILDALRHQPQPAAVQAITNLLDSAGAMKYFAAPERPREIVAEASARGIGVMGIRAVQAGALTVRMDRALPPEDGDARDYERAAPFRALCARWSENPAHVAHRYALAMAGLDTLVLGVKNRQELRECLAAEREGPLEAEKVAEIEALGLRTL